MIIQELLAKIKQITLNIVYLQKRLRLKKNEEMVRRICYEEKLSADVTNMICRVIHCESGFDDKAVCRNKNGTFDYGIIQANSYWYIDRAKLITQDEAMNNPEKAVRLMISRYKQGQLKDWLCYSSNAYKKFSGVI